MPRTGAAARARIIVCVCATLIACGTPDAPAPAPDASAPDAHAPDAPDASVPDALALGPTGDFRTTAITRGGITVTDEDRPVTVGGVTTLLRVNGVLHLGADGAAWRSSVTVRDGQFIDPNTFHGSTSFESSSGTSQLTLFGDPFTLEWTRTTPPEAFTLRLAGGPDSFSFERVVAPSDDTLPIVGTISVTAGAPGFFAPRIAFVSLLRDDDGSTRYIVIDDPPYDDDRALDTLPATGAAPITADLALPYDLSRTEGAIGLQRILFGTAFLAAGLVVVYDDRDGDGRLSAPLAPLDCTPALDCIRGVAPLAVAYRLGGSPELTASAWGRLLPRWSWAVPGRTADAPSATAYLSLDAQTAPVPLDLVLLVDQALLDFPPTPL